MDTKWFTVEEIDNSTYALSEYNHWEKAHSYLILGSKRACLIDTGLGIGNIKEVTDELTNLPIKVITTHFHWDHIGGHSLYDSISVHKNEVKWMRRGIPISLEKIKKNLLKDINEEKLPNYFNINDYNIFTGEPDHQLTDNEIINLGDRSLQVLHTPGHSPGHICLIDEKRGYLFSGDLLYKGTLYAFYTSTNPKEFYKSINRLSKFDIERILPGHNEIVIENEFVKKVQQAFEELKQNNLLFHGSGLHEYNTFKIKL